MEFNKYLQEQRARHPAMQPQDVVKMCYQAAFGAEHLLADTQAAWKYLEREYAAVSAQEGVLCEAISDEVCRVNLSAWKAVGLPAEWLFRMFVSSCVVQEGRKDVFLEYLRQAQEALGALDMRFSQKDWQTYLKDYEERGMPAVHHSDRYREQEKPAYRILSRRFERLLPVLTAAAAKADKPVCVIAIDGRAASGKTTLAEALQNILDAEVAHMDDFFLPPALRTEERLSEAGGNVHYERFAEEVLPRIAQPEAFAYRIFDCGQMDYDGERSIGGKRFRIVEGSYSCHPRFGDYADVRVFSDVAYEEQLRRILARNGEALLRMFRERWIPMEEAYFAAYRTKERADICLQ